MSSAGRKSHATLKMALLWLYWRARWVALIWAPGHLRIIFSQYGKLIAPQVERAKAIYFTATEPRFRVMTITQYCRLARSKSRVIMKSETNAPTDIRSASLSGGAARTMKCRPQPTPSIALFEIRLAFVLGASDIVFFRRMAIVHNAFIEKRFFPCDEYNGLICVRTGRITIQNRTRGIPRSFDEAISLISTSATNWAHWLTEVLPRAVIIGGLEQYQGLPILVDEWMTESMEQSLRWAFGDRSLVKVRRGELIKVGLCICVSPSAQVPFDYRIPGDMRYEDVVFCPSAIISVQAHASTTLTGSAQNGRKVFLRRNRSGARQMIGIGRIESAIQQCGFEMVSPEKMTFDEQIEAVRGADLIVGQAGAGIMNMMFAPRGCRIYVITTLTSVNNYFYFSSVADILGHNLTYLFVDAATGSAEADANQAPVVDAEQVMNMLRRCGEAVH